MSHTRRYHDTGTTPQRARCPGTRRAGLDHFPPTRIAALRRLLGVDPTTYARTRNHLDGAVTGLSPYFTHGFITEAEAFTAWRARFDLTLSDKLGMELAWRCFFAHVRGWAGEAIFTALRPALRDDYAPGLPADVLEARTGVPVIDTSVRHLYETGYLHNHARLWLASYVVHSRKTHWRAGADWMFAHLLDGDAASNHLSWQWVAGTFSTKPYLFNADNVARFAPARASPGTSIDTNYPALEDWARYGGDAGPEPGTHRGRAVPPLYAVPPGHANATLPSLAGRRIALVHPWALGWAPAGGADYTLGVVFPAAHAVRPWSARRWDFVLEGMRRRCDAVWVGDPAVLATALSGSLCLSRMVQQPAYVTALSRLPMIWCKTAAALPDAGLNATSFSAYIKALQRRAPGLFGTHT